MKFKPWVANLGLLLGSLGFGIAVGEIGLRLAGVSYPPPPDPESETLAYTVKDPNRGWAPKPNAKTVWVGEGLVSEIQMNSAGFRDRERTMIKPENTFRVAVLGDSFIEALHVPQEQTATAVMEKLLANCSALKGQNVEVLNFGVQGYGTAQELMTLRHHVWQFSPDLVILGFYPGNDIRNNYKPLEHDHLRPYFSLHNSNQIGSQIGSQIGNQTSHQTDEWMIDYSFRNLSPKARDYYAFAQVDRLPQGLVERSRILQLIRQAEITAKQRQYQEDYEEINTNFYKEPPDENWETAWAVTEGLIKLMRDEVTAQGVDFLVVTISDSYQVNPKSKKRKEFMEEYNIENLFYPDQRIAEFGKQEGIPVFRLAEPLLEQAEKRGECLHGFENALPCEGHWNVAGNQVAGELLADQVCQKVATQDISNK
ncbi:MAG: SGNH/GDSL hydrolase family protein [Microcoleaceae cyanobacterium]